MNTLRIRRIDKLNLAIERRRVSCTGAERWQLVGYYGSAFGLASALVDELTDCPEAATVAGQVDAMMGLIDARTDKLSGQIDELLKRADALLENGERLELVLGG